MMNTKYKQHNLKPKRGIRCLRLGTACYPSILNPLLGAFISLFCAIALTADAQKNTKAKDDKKLLELFDVLKNADGYSYQIAVQSSIAGDTQKTLLQTRINYASKSAFIIYSKTENELFFLCSKGQFRVEKDKKTVYYKTYDNDSILAQMKHYYAQQMAIAMDSIFLTDALIAQKKTINKNVFYQLIYPPYAVVKDFNILARNSDGMPERLQYTIEQASNPNANSIRVRQQLTMDHYRHAMPEEVKKLVTDTKDLFQFLQQKYAGYTLNKI
jgi:hypothetical protein